jgi:mRNA interferase RelE/StbE
VGKYEVLIKPSAKNELFAVPVKMDRQRLVQRIEQLADEPGPYGCKKLTRLEWSRLRQGPYRIIYEIRDTMFVILVVTLGHRREVARDL